MTIQQTPQADEFKRQLRDSLQRETLNSGAIKIARHANVYTCGDQDEMVYFIESGRSNCSCSRPKARNVSWLSIAGETSLVSYVYRD